ncbi:MAG: type II toxin-antitoxin system RelE/ParE family toxin [Patescibacteria group bacterium]
MLIKEIRYNDAFAKQFSGLPRIIQLKACKKEAIFRKNPFHPSLRLHKLKGKLDGLWSISIDMSYRIIFKPLENGVILFVSVGVHAIYG